MALELGDACSYEYGNFLEAGARPTPRHVGKLAPTTTYPSKTQSQSVQHSRELDAEARSEGSLRLVIQASTLLT